MALTFYSSKSLHDLIPKCCCSLCDVQVSWEQRWQTLSNPLNPHQKKYRWHEVCTAQRCLIAVTLCEIKSSNNVCRKVRGGGVRGLSRVLHIYFSISQQYYLAIPNSLSIVHQVPKCIIGVIVLVVIVACRIMFIFQLFQLMIKTLTAMMRLFLCGVCCGRVLPVGV